MTSFISLIALSVLLCVLAAEGKYEYGRSRRIRVSDDVSWEEYKKQFGKKYATAESDAAHKKAFQRTQSRVRDHNGRRHRGEASFTLEHNAFSDFLPEEFNRVRGLRAQKSGGGVSVIYNSDCSNFVPPAANSCSTDQTPAAINWVEKGRVTPVKDQGQCGSCYAFSATGALEGQLAAKTGKLISLSEQNIVDCASVNSDGCEGGWPTYVMNYIAKNGIASEAAYPYKAKDANKCLFKSPAAVAPATVKGCSAVQPNNETALKIAVATKGPISVCLDMNMQAMYTNGIEIFDDPTCKDRSLNHAVLIVGYGTDPQTKKDYWLVKNSWGSNGWGDDGYFKVVRGKNCLGIAAEAAYPLV